MISRKDSAATGHRPFSPVSSWQIQFSLLGGAVAWLAHLLLAYLISEFGCLLNLGNTLIGPISIVSWAILVVSGLTLAMAVAATVSSKNLGNRAREIETAETSDEVPDALGFTARSGWAINLLFVFIILVQSVPVFYFLTDC